jgi:hypothetical protein
MADIVTKEQIDAAEKAFQDAVNAHAQAAIGYNNVVTPFVTARQALRATYAAEAQANQVLADLIANYKPEQVPPVPSDE